MNDMKGKIVVFGHRMASDGRREWVVDLEREYVGTVYDVSEQFKSEQVYRVTARSYPSIKPFDVPVSKMRVLANRWQDLGPLWELIVTQNSVVVDMADALDRMAGEYERRIGEIVEQAQAEIDEAIIKYLAKQSDD